MGKQGRKVYVIGVGMTSFRKPRGEVDYPELALEAAVKSMLDAGVNYDEVEAAYVGYAYGDTCCGQRSLYQLGMTGIPVQNVNNACSTGSSALFLARQAVEFGMADCTLALGFEVMAPGQITSPFKNMTAPIDKTYKIIRETRGGEGPPTSLIFGNGGKEHNEKYGSTIEHIAATAKNHRHSVKNPYSQFRNDMTTEEVLKDKQISNILTRGMCCPTSDGAAAVVVASEEFVKAHNLENQALEFKAQAVATDDTMLFATKSAIELTGANMTRRAAREAFQKAGLTPNDIKVIELHDCFAPNELLVYEGLGLCPEGQAGKLVDAGDNTYGGKWVINPSGGLLSKGHPLGATGLGMIFYIATQLRGLAGPMQIEECHPNYKGKAAYGLAHNLGLGGSCSVSILGRPSFYKAGGSDGVSRVGYNFGYECRGITKADVDKVKSKKAFLDFALAPEPMPKNQKKLPPRNQAAVSKL